jgi:DMSO/TMAO reductase YedYZ molybdopterin-dependent catalytic subunit
MIRKLLNWSYGIFFVCGLAAGIAAISLSLIFKISFNGIFVPETASQALVSLTSGQVESVAVETLGPLAKYSSFFGAIFANILLYGIIGVFLGTLYNKIHSKKFISRALLSSIVSYVILLVITVSFILINTVPGQELLIPSVNLSILFVPHLVYGFIFSFFFKRISKDKSSFPSVSRQKPQTIDHIAKEPMSTTTTEIDLKKRALLRALVVSVIALPIMYFGLNRLFSHTEQQLPASTPSSSSQNTQLVPKSRPPGFGDAILTPLIDAEETPTYLFYRIDKNAIVPEVDAAGWSLNIKGMVNNPMVMNYDQIKAMNSIEQYATLSCVSNKIGGDLVSTALWKGVRLKDILSKAQVKSVVKYIVFRCFDGYDVGIPLKSGMMDGTILAYNMNNNPLPNDHGFPLRAIVPGFYGMMNPKWITEIELVDSTYEGFWQRKGWTNNGNENIYSSIITTGNQDIRNRFPHLVNDNLAIGKTSQIAGVAYAGDRGISKIEVSTDGGNTWKSAIVKDPLSKYTWVLWTSGFTPKVNGNYNIIVRATDKTGRVQTSDFAEPFPNGASGYDMVNANV